MESEACSFARCVNASTARGDRFSATNATMGNSKHKRRAIRVGRTRPNAASQRITGPVATRVQIGAREPVVNIAPTTRVNARRGTILFLMRQPFAQLYPIARNATKVRNAVYPEIYEKVPEVRTIFS